MTVLIRITAGGLWLSMFLAAAGAAEPGNVESAVKAAAERLGCTVATVTPLARPHDGVWEVRCRDAHIIWLHRVDGAWTVKPIG